jgi:osmotically-inducible protein OsmY
MARTDSFSTTPIVGDPVAPEETTLRGRRSRIVRRNAALGVMVLALVVVLGYLISRQGWTITASQAHGVAEAVKDTTAAVRGTSTDAATTAKAKAALALSKRVSALDVNVDTTNGVTTLTGKVPTLEGKELAGQIVADTSGVREMRNLLTVDPTMRPEQERERLARRVNDLETQIALSEALQDTPELVGARLKVRVVDGVASLDGGVTSEAQKVRAEELARTFPGVQRLSSNLRVAPRY